MNAAEILAAYVVAAILMFEWMETDTYGLDITRWQSMTPYQMFLLETFDRDMSIHYRIILVLTLPYLFTKYLVTQSKKHP